MLDHPGATTRPGPEMLAELMASRDPGPAAGGARMLCGHFEWDGTLDHPVFAELPGVVVVRNLFTRDGGGLFRTVVDLITAEQTGAAPGAAAVADRMGEVLFVSLLRAWLADQAPRRGVLAALRDARRRSICGSWRRRRACRAPPLPSSSAPPSGCRPRAI